MHIRSRQSADEQRLVELAEAVHRYDGYPHHLPDGDYRRFLFGYECLGAWVALVDGKLVAQVALHPRSSPPVMQLASVVTGRPLDGFGVVARLLVDPPQRRHGAGRALLARAAEEAICRGLVPVLDVVADAANAISLYERCGWTRMGTVSVTFAAGTSVDEHVYLAPGALGPA